MSKHNLLPCPFCGGNPKIEESVDSTQGHYQIAWVECQECGSRTKEEIEWGNDYIGIVVSLWNSRPILRTADA